MSSALFIALEREIPGFDSQVNGKFVARDHDWLEKASKQLKVAPLSKFVSMDPEELEGFLEDEGVDSEEAFPEGVPKLEWFAPDKGLQTVQALIKHVVANPKAVKHPNDVLEDLKQYEEVLKRAAAAGVRWHFQWDY